MLLRPISQSLDARLHVHLQLRSGRLTRWHPSISLPDPRVSDAGAARPARRAESQLLVRVRPRILAQARRPGLDRTGLAQTLRWPRAQQYRALRAAGGTA